MITLSTISREGETVNAYAQGKDYKRVGEFLYSIQDKKAYPSDIIITEGNKRLAIICRRCGNHHVFYTDGTTGCNNPVCLLG